MEAMVTLVALVCVDLLTGVVLGIALSLAKLLCEVSHLDIEIRQGADPMRRDIHLHGSATVLRLPKLASALESVPRSAELHVHLEELDYIDHACIDLLMGWEKQHASSGGRLFIDWDDLQALFRRESGPSMAPGDAPERSAA